MPRQQIGRPLDDRKRQLCVKTHQQSHREADEYRRRQHAVERHSGLAAGRNNLWIDDDDVRHREEGGDTGNRFGFEIGLLLRRNHKHRGHRGKQLKEDQSDY